MFPNQNDGGRPRIHSRRTTFESAPKHVSQNGKTQERVAQTSPELRGLASEKNPLSDFHSFSPTKKNLNPTAYPRKSLENVFRFSAAVCAENIFQRRRKMIQSRWESWAARNLKYGMSEKSLRKPLFFAGGCLRSRGRSFNRASVSKDVFHRIRESQAGNRERNTAWLFRNSHAHASPWKGSGLPANDGKKVWKEKNAVFRGVFGPQSVTLGVRYKIPGARKLLCSVDKIEGHSVGRWGMTCRSLVWVFSPVWRRLGQLSSPHEYAGVGTFSGVFQRGVMSGWCKCSKSGWGVPIIGCALQISNSQNHVEKFAGFTSYHPCTRGFPVPPRSDAQT